jgi:hypothetical protein
MERSWTVVLISRAASNTVVEGSWVVATGSEIMSTESPKASFQ